MSRTTLALACGASAVLMLTGCSTSHKSATTVKAAITQPAISSRAASVSTPTISASTPKRAAVAGALSGAWNGTYSGAYQGTFRLTWLQSGSVLSGSIALSAPADTVNINGTVTGGAIKFGTVGSAGITYQGQVSGNSMSGTYQVQGGASGVGGQWSAIRG